MEAYFRLKEIAYCKGNPCVTVNRSLAEQVNRQPGLLRTLAFLASWYDAVSYVGLALDRDGWRAIATTYPQLAKELGIPQRTVEDHLPQLRELGAADWERQGRKIMIIVRGDMSARHGDCVRVPDLLWLMCGKNFARAWMLAHPSSNSIRTAVGSYGRSTM